MTVRKPGGLVLCLCLALIGAAHAQQADKRQVIDAARANNPDLKVKIDPRTGMPTSITGLTRANPAASLGASSTPEPSEDDVRKAVDAWFKAGELSAAFSTRNTQTKYETQRVRKDPDLPGRYVAHVEQRVNGIPVYGSSAKVTVDRSLNPMMLTSSVSSVDLESTTPQVSEGDAITAARDALTAFAKNRPTIGGMSPPMPDLNSASTTTQLTVFDPSLVNQKVGGPTRLAWLVSIDSYRVFVDAKTKEVFYFYRDQPTVLARRVFDLAQSQNFPGQKVLDDETRDRIDPIPDDAALAYVNTGAVRDFYYLVLGRDSYEDNDPTKPSPSATMESYVRYGNMANAFWCRSASFQCPKADVMVFGPNFAGAIDVVGHEITHGVIAYEADLLYTDEPGAVNESLADLFGTLIEFHVKGTAGNWLIGESLPGFSMSAPLRDMSNPNMADSAHHSLFDKTADYSLATNRGQPARYDQYVQPTDKICASTTDTENGCVHINSGIFNKFAFLTSEGGEGVTGIGKQKLGRIAYRALTTKLNKSSGLVAAAEAFAQACGDLADAKIAQITDDDCKQLSAAQQAVGLVLTN